MGTSMLASVSMVKLGRSGRRQPSTPTKPVLDCCTRGRWASPIGYHSVNVIKLSEVAARVAPTEGRKRIEGCGGRDEVWPTRTPRYASAGSGYSGCYQMTSRLKSGTHPLVDALPLNVWYNSSLGHDLSDRILTKV